MPSLLFRIEGKGFLFIEGLVPMSGPCGVHSRAILEPWDVANSFLANSRMQESYLAIALGTCDPLEAVIMNDVRLCTCSSL